MSAEPHIALWPNVPKCVFIPVPLDDELLPDNRTIDRKNLDVSVNDTFDGNHSAKCMQLNILEDEYDKDTIPCVDDVTSSIFTCNTMDDDSVGNVS